ncbi:hypothetical protein SAY87_014964 [Trapa incisa]|uniref:Non-haem dioxygenase N-terminal domain-containing protein n=1 Tax=Trapa incisa TaxID=236973 RepID=A0AAN7GPC2_9MYRT|nr:hypothetical protein SAY87_014964 [Trapa incisa]
MEDSNYKLESQHQNLFFDSIVLPFQPDVPPPFIWPHHERPCGGLPELAVPLIDLTSFLSGDPSSISETIFVVHYACKKHGSFMVVNHGIDRGLIREAHEHMDGFFGMALSEKQKAQRKAGEPCGYASSFTGRFTSKLPWKETLSFRYLPVDIHGGSSTCVEEYFTNVLGKEFEKSG